VKVSFHPAQVVTPNKDKIKVPAFKMDETPQKKGATPYSSSQ
jgi:hypothetical protein